MKTIKRGFRIQIPLLVFILPFIMTSMTGCQKDKTLDLDITEFQWDLKSISDAGQKQKRPSGDFFRDGAYLLYFTSDSTLMLNTSVNYAGGKYQIISKGEIDIIHYDAMTEACCETDFDLKMIDVFNKMTSYTVFGNTLTFRGNSSKLEFKKR